VAFSPDGQTIATASDDQTVKLWNRQGEELQTLKGHSNWVNSVAFSPDGETIATASGDQTVKLWNFQLDNLMAKGCNWLGTYFVKQSPELLMELETCQKSDPSLRVAAAPMLVTQGEQLARDGNIKRARELFQQAVAWDSRLDIDAKTKAQNVATAQTLVSEAEELAQAGKIFDATAKLIEAKQLDFSLDFEPETRAKELAIQKYLTKGNQFLNERKVPEAVVAYRQAEALGLRDRISAYDWNTLCWDGSTYNHAEAVMFACEKAIALAPEDGYFNDGRGLARALTGDIQGAVADFKVFIELTSSNKEQKAQRQEWIKALEQGNNPFTPEVLESLRQP
jgi:tetratricopeptide (TPR) repeat protein